MTVKQKLEDMLIQRGMSNQQAEEVLKLALPEINKSMEEPYELPSGSTVQPYAISWETRCDDYPDVIYGIWFSIMNPIAVKWIKENKPQAWFLPVFEN